MTVDEIHAFLELAPYRFAKSMPQNPHEYTLMEYWSQKDAFEEVLKFLEINGKSEKFFNKTFRYYRHGVYKYWIMPSYTGGFLINRTLI